MSTDLPRKELERTIKSLLLDVDITQKAEIFNELVENGKMVQSQKNWFASICFDDKDNSQPDFQVIITDLLHELGIPANLKGHQYLREGILLMLHNEAYSHSMTKMFYPTLAKKFNSTPSRVERAIRHAIVIGYGRGDSDSWYMYFAHSINPDKEKPTNSEFLAMIVDRLKLEYMQI